MSKSFWLFGTFVRLIADEKETNGQYDLVEGRFQPGTETPLHKHTNYSELIYVIEGEFTVYTPGRTVVLHEGDSIFVPKHTPHAVAATGDVFSRGLTVAAPSGFAKLIYAAGQPGTFEAKPTPDPLEMEKFSRVSEELGDVILGLPGTRP